MAAMTPGAKVIATADDAILAKLATVQAGYYEDPFLGPFERRASGITGGSGRSRRQVQPIIKRGTHARVCCMDRAISSFLTEGRRQVIVLGSGKDTSFFRHRLPKDTLWLEVDHASVLQTKATIIQDSPNIFQSTVQKTANGFCIRRENKGGGQKTCHLIQHDLMQPPKDLISKLKQSTDQLDLQAPTLLLFECVLMYLPEETSRLVQTCFAQEFAHAVLCCYEPILGSDSFGTMMEQNLNRAGVAPDGSCLRTTRTLTQQLSKAIDCGFHTAIGCNMAVAYETVMTQEQRSRANKCEFLDELEEWFLIMRHYCVFVAAVSSSETEHFCGPDLGFMASKCEKITK